MSSQPRINYRDNAKKVYKLNQEVRINNPGSQRHGKLVKIVGFGLIPEYYILEEEYHKTFICKECRFQLPEMPLSAEADNYEDADEEGEDRVQTHLRDVLSMVKEKEDE